MTNVRGEWLTKQEARPTFYISWKLIETWEENARLSYFSHPLLRLHGSVAAGNCSGYLSYFDLDIMDLHCVGLTVSIRNLSGSGFHHVSKFCQIPLLALANSRRLLWCEIPLMEYGHRGRTVKSWHAIGNFEG